MIACKLRIAIALALCALFSGAGAWAAAYSFPTGLHNPYALEVPYDFGGTIYSQINIGSGASVKVDTTATVINNGGININQGYLKVLGALWLTKGTMSITGGGDVENSARAYISSNNNATASATVSGTGSTWTSGYLYVGYAGAGTLSIANGATVSSSTSYIGLTATATGSATVSGSGSVWNCGNLLVGDTGTGTLYINNSGKVSSSGDINIGNNNTSHGTVEVTGGGVLSGAKTLNLGRDAGANGSLLVSGLGSKVDVNSHLYLGKAGTGSLTIDNGGQVKSVNSSYNRAYIGTEAGSSGTATVTGAGSVWAVPELYVGEKGSGSITVKNGGRIDSTNAYIAHDSGNGSATVTGAGSVWNNTAVLSLGYAGSNSLAINDGGAITTGIFEMKPAANLFFSLSSLMSATVNPAYAAITANELRLGGKMTVSLFEDYIPTVGTVFNLFDWGTLVGSFDSSITLAFNTPGVTFDTSFLPTNGTIVVLTSSASGESSAVPEPGLVALLLLGLILACAPYRRLALKKV